MFSHKLQRNNFKINSLQQVPPNVPPEADDHTARSKQALKYLRQGLRGSFSSGVSIIVGWLDAAYFGPKQSVGGRLILYHLEILSTQMKLCKVEPTRRKYFKHFYFSLLPAYVQSISSS